MTQLWVGVIAILVGALFCFRGSLALRAVISIWGAFAGFWIGAWAAAALTGEALLGGPFGWIAGLALALLLGGLAHTFYVLAVVISMGSIGLALGSGLAAALGVTSDGVVVVAGLVGATALAVLALTTNLPHVLLVVVSAAGGAGAIVAGLVLVLGVVGLEAGQAAVRGALAGQWWWSALHLALTAAGVVVQWRSTGRPNARTEWRQVQAPRS